MPRPYYFFGRNRIFLPKLVGAFLILIALLMFVSASGKMFDSWDALKHYPECIEKKDIGLDEFEQVKYCKQSLGEITGLHLRPDQGRVTSRQFVVALLPPIAELLFWAMAFVVGLVLYQTGIFKHLPAAQPEKKKGRKRKP